MLMGHPVIESPSVPPASIRLLGGQEKAYCKKKEENMEICVYKTGSLGITGKTCGEIVV